MDPSEVRALFPVLEQRAYMFSGGVAPASKPMLAAIQRFTDHLTNDPGDLYKHTHTDFDVARAAYAALIGADVDEIAVTDSTGTGSNLAVELIEPIAGSNVVFDELSYPSAVYPWMLPPRDHVERRFVKIRDGLVQLDDLAEAIDDNTIAVSISHVSQTTGFRYDLGAVAALAHEHGAPLLVDAMQSAGAIRIDVHEMGVDLLSTGAMKWLLGSAGVGFFYVARRHLDRMPPHAGGQGAIDDPRPLGEHEFKPKPGADRFHIGMPNLMGLAATTPGLEILAAVGIDRIEDHVLDLTGYCIAELKERGQKVLTPAEPQHRAGIVAMELEDAAELDSFLIDRGVDGYYYRQMFRVDPHVFNNRDDIDRFLAGLDVYMAQR